MVAGRPANFVSRQQEYFGGKTICAGGKASVVAGAVLVRNLNLLDSSTDVGIKQVIEGAVQVGMDAGILIGVVVATKRAGGVSSTHVPSQESS